MIDELRTRIRSQFRPDFDFVTVEDVPFTRPSKLASVALISTAGLHLDDQPPFDRVTPAGDCSFRRIRLDDDLSRLQADPHQPAGQDLNCAFPLALLSNAAATHYSLSGAIPDPRPLLEETAPQIARELDADAVIIAPS